MTIVVGVSSLFDAFVIADCRLTFNAHGKKRKRDCCQKLFVANERSIVGLAGHLCLARDLAFGVVQRIRAEPDQQSWLQDDVQLRNYIAEGVRLHELMRTGHAACKESEAALLIAWMDYARLTPTGRWSNGPPSPDSRIAVVHWRRPELIIRRKHRGTEVIGRVPQFARELHTEPFADLVTYFGRFDGDPDVMDAQRALLATTEVRKRLTERGRTEGVGGLYQVMTLGSRGVRAVPYFYLADVEPGYRTYVAMRIANGEWVQEHRPTGIVMRVKSPFDINEAWATRPDAVFDPPQRLTRESPGVFPARQVETVFSLYNPPLVPEAIRPSWGDAPLAPLSDGPGWATRR